MGLGGSTHEGVGGGAQSTLSPLPTCTVFNFTWSVGGRPPSYTICWYISYSARESGGLHENCNRPISEPIYQF